MSLRERKRDRDVRFVPEADINLELLDCIVRSHASTRGGKNSTLPLLR
jgi:hypothetical protein